MKSNKVKTYKYSLSSSTEVFSVIEQIKENKIEVPFIQIASKLHNTVLVHKLEKELKKLFPDLEIFHIKVTDDATKLIIYSFNHDAIEISSVENELIYNLEKQLSDTQEGVNDARTKYFQTYFTDSLTDLPNIYQLRKDLANNDKAGLVLIKIDNFISINNFYGFIVGDYTLENIAAHLKVMLQEHRLYRYAGAEFALLLKEQTTFYELKDYLQKLYDDLKSFSIEYQESKIYLEFSLASSGSVTTDDIFSKVSMALNYANENNLPFWVYEDRMSFESEYANNFQLSNLVRSAIEEARITPYYQPIIDNKTMRIEKYECLARLIDENNNVISPNLFLPVAKKIKVYNFLTKVIIDKSFQEFENNNYDLSINISIEDITNSEIFDFIIQKLKSSNIASRLTFELLESETIQDYEKVTRFINEVKRYGAKIAIDDFGGGYSNLSYITKVAIDYLKIDGSLINDIDTNKNSFMLVESIVAFAKKFNIKTVAEHVHSSAVLDKVKELDIDYSQGYFIDKPSVDICL